MNLLIIFAIKIHNLNNFTFQYPTYYLVFCLLIALLFAVGLYYRENRLKDINVGWTWLLAILRFLGVFGILFLLLGPMFRNIMEQTKNPSIIIVQDATESVNNDIETNNTLKEISEKLSANYQVDEYHFDNDLREGFSDSLIGKSTNIAKVFDYIDETYANQNVGAILLSTDGIYNEGINPFYHKNNIKSPVYIIPQGDTTAKKDIILKQIYHNKIAYLGDKFIVQPDVSAINFKGKSSTLSIYENSLRGKKLAQKTINFDSNDDYDSYEFEIAADRVGVTKYVVDIKSLTGELTTRNNRQTIYVDVLDSRQKVLILADSPHPDVAALKHLILTNKNYEVNYLPVNKYENNIKNYDLVILHNLPSKNATIPADILNSIIPKWFILGSQTSIGAFNSVQDVLRVEGKTTATNEVTASMTTKFTPFEVDDDIKTNIPRFSPLMNAFGTYRAMPSTQVLMNQKIGQVKMDYPLLSFNIHGDKRQAVLAGEGVWKWKLNDFQANGNFVVMESLINQVVQYLTIKEDKRKFRANPTHQVFKQYEAITFDAELYNDSYEKINTPDVNMVITNSDGEEYPYTFSKTADFYQLNAGEFPAGSYQYSATTKFNGESHHVNGKFSVQEVDLESVNLEADHILLQSIAEKHNGELFYNKSSDEIIKAIQDKNPLKPIVYQTSKTDSLMNLSWLLFLLAAIFIAEWFIRRYLGTY